MTEWNWAVIIYYLTVGALGVAAWSYFGGRQERAIAAKQAAEAAEKPKA